MVPKKRKIDTLGPSLSAYAARKPPHKSRLLTAIDVQNSPPPAMSSNNLPYTGSSKLKANSVFPKPTSSETLQQPPSAELDVERRSESEENLIQDIPLTLLSTFQPSDHNVLAKVGNDTQDSWTVRLESGEKLVLLGVYDLWIRKGSIIILGALIHASPKLYRIYAPSTHSLPSIHHTQDPHDGQTRQSEITIISCKTNILLFGHISPAFRRIWNHVAPSQHEPVDHALGRSYSYLHESSDDLYRRPLTVIEPSNDWKVLISRLSTSVSGLPKAILICGPKSSGKSTFMRQLINGSLTWFGSAAASDGVALLDIDPGQPEFSPPGQVSLLHIRSCILSPPFTHPVLQNNSENKLIRAHHFGALTPNFDPVHYIQCVKELESHYQQLLSSSPSCPLVINCSGWAFGGGLDILIELIQCLRITDVVYMSTTGPRGVVDRLNKETRQVDIPLHMLKSQPSEYATRTALDLRIMQTLSYFHASEPEGDESQWDPSVISLMESLSLRYAGKDQMLFGIMVPGEELDLLCLADLIDGSVLGVVVVEDGSILPTQQMSEFKDGHSQAGSFDTSQFLDEHSFDICTSVSDMADEERGKYGYEGVLERSSEPPHAASSQREPEHPFIRRTKEGLPYYFQGAGSCVSLDPKNTRSIGQVLIRAIDKSNKDLHVITPLPKQLFTELRQSGTRIILVRGRLDLPTWSYHEKSTRLLALEENDSRDHNASRQVDNLVDETDSDLAFEIGNETEKADWMTVIRGKKDKDKRKDKVWKARRNLQTGDLKGLHDS